MERQQVNNIFIVPLVPPLSPPSLTGWKAFILIARIETAVLRVEGLNMIADDQSNSQIKTFSYLLTGEVWKEVEQ